MDSFVRDNEVEMQARLEAVPAPSRAARALEGYLMEEEKRDQPQTASSRGDAVAGDFAAVGATLPILGLLLVWRWRRRRAA
jgi:uncharacterized protein (TIGR03382 family)